MLDLQRIKLSTGSLKLHSFISVRDVHISSRSYDGESQISVLDGSRYCTDPRDTSLLFKEPETGKGKLFDFIT